MYSWGRARSWEVIGGGMEVDLVGLDEGLGGVEL